MADSPAKRHLQRVEAEEAARRAAGGNLVEGTPIYQQTLLQLATDRARLKQIQSSQAKGQLKAALLPTYDAYIDGVLAADAGGQDDVVSTLMLWNIDAGLYDAALDIAAYVLAHGLTMPDRFERTAGCVVAEEIGIAALNALKTGAAFDLGVLSRAVEVTDGHDMPDQVRARLLLARARGLLATNTEATPLDAEAASTAIDDLRRAIQLHDSCGGKEDLKRAERLLTKIEGNQSND
ncbi:terminase [Stenotrophomonas maltophilia]|uniref:phage terminase small subunit n=1 Tax=Stenotrophomonas maltophilia TaxID=40324 RepID=UPI0015DFB2A1|nr:phage terminase small subunit [Stenotrophomonas maltophilia]MBA0371145.1 terminase [Stenotrophomonas maltophilia]MBH1558476.1 terminase [Stenotrophomonas maltophilia]